MSKQIKAVNTITELRQELSSIPRVRLEFAKAITELLAAHNISASGDLLGRLTIATCDEVVSDSGETLAVWTN
jgi:hypothetical protein